MKRNKPNGFEEKLQHSIDLLQKAEKLALQYDETDGFYLAFSGGKDSQALYHVAQMAGVKFKAHMNFTSVDPPQVIRFVRRQYPDVVTHAPRKSIYDLAIERGILPSMRIRCCCADLKESAGAGKVTLIGIRKQESTRRAKRHEVEVSGKQFSGNLEEFFDWREHRLQEKEEKLIRKMKREGKKVNEDFFSAEKEHEVRCINGKDSILVSPIFEWTEQDVWYFLDEVVKVPHCELYEQGYKRIGCILCPMSQYRQKVKEMRDFPHVKRGWIRAIKEIRRGGDFSTDISGGTSEQTGVSCRPTTDYSNTGITPPNRPEWMQKVLQLRDGGCAEYHKGPIQQFEKIKPIRTDILQRTIQGIHSTTDQIYPPPHTQRIPVERGLGKENQNLQREDGVLQEREHSRIHVHWNRKANTGIWRGVFGKPLCGWQRRGADRRRDCRNDI